MQKVSVLNHAVEFYVQACESFVNPPDEYRSEVTTCINVCKEINKHTAQAFSRNNIEEQLDYLDKAVKYGKDFRDCLDKFQNNSAFSQDILSRLAELSYRTEREIKQIVPLLLNE